MAQGQALTAGAVVMRDPAERHVLRGPQASARRACAWSVDSQKSVSETACLIVSQPGGGEDRGGGKRFSSASSRISIDIDLRTTATSASYANVFTSSVLGGALGRDPVDKINRMSPPRSK